MRIDKHICKDNWHEIKDILPHITEIKSLELSDMGLTEIPKMSHIIIRCDFCCTYNQITSFKDCPNINGGFCCNNNQITSFKDCPKIGGYFHSGNLVFDIIHEYSKKKKISLLEAQIQLHNKRDKEILEHIDKFPDLVAYIRLKELSKLLCA